MTRYITKVVSSSTEEGLDREIREYLKTIEGRDDIMFLGPATFRFHVCGTHLDGGAEWLFTCMIVYLEVTEDEEED